MRTRERIKRDLYIAKNSRDRFAARLNDPLSSWATWESRGRIKFWQANINELNRELLALVEAELYEVNGKWSASWVELDKARRHNYRNKVTKLINEQLSLDSERNALNRERTTILDNLNQENNVNTGSRTNDHDIDESVTTPGTDPEVEVKKRIQLIKNELEGRRTAVQKHFDTTQDEIERLNRRQAERRAEIDALSFYIDSL